MFSFTRSRANGAPPLLGLLLALLIVSCGGGGGGGAAVSMSPVQKVGEILGSPNQVATGELRTQFGYAGNVATSLAIQSGGKANILDMLFLTRGSSPQDKLQGRLAADVEQQLAEYVRANAALLLPGVRVLIADEVFWNPPDVNDSPSILQPQLTALSAAVALVRRYLPGASVGITLTPYASFGRPNTVDFMRRAIALADWVGTDVYWFGDPSPIAGLHQWTADFVNFAKSARPGVETWYVAQAFRLAGTDLVQFRSFIAEELKYASGYDGILFFGWQFTSELDPASAGRFFDPETKRLYSRYLMSVP